MNICDAPACHFDKVATIPIISFEIFILVATAIMLFGLSKIKEKILWRYLIVVIGIFIFEFFTSPMWNNFHMGTWAYVYRDVSWILTLGWGTLILSVVTLVDKFFPKWKEWKKFLLYLGSLTVLVFIFDAIVIQLGIRSYSPEVMEVLSGNTLFGVPLEALYYVPVFSALVIGFAKYWNLILDDELVVPVKKRRWLRDFFIAFVAVFLFEIMIEPMVVNVNLPDWSYIYRDISILMTGGWILIIWLAVSLVEKFFQWLPLNERFTLCILFGTIITLPIEGYLMRNGFREYGQSSVDNFSGLMTPLSQIPIEVMVAIPFYLALIMAFIRYWIFVFENKY